jgi:hypothetical protein
MRWYNKILRNALQMCVLIQLPAAFGQENPAPPETTTAADSTMPSGKAAAIDGQGTDWKTLGAGDFEWTNCEATTFSWDGALAKCTGKPIGVLRSVKKYQNFELVAYWRHLESGGNSGFFVWSPDEAFEGIKPDQLPKGGIEVQMLDHGYTENYEKRTGKKATWFSTNGDVFPVGTSKMKPFEPRSPDGKRSFPREKRSLGTPQWNHYYVRAINGEVRLWVNGGEVSGGRDCTPSSGYLCLESEGAPVQWKDIKLRELP